MTGDEYRASLKHLGLTQAGAGRFFHAHPVTGRRWAVDGPPPVVAMFLMLMLELDVTPDWVMKKVWQPPP